MDHFRYADSKTISNANNGKTITKTCYNPRSVYGSQVIAFNTKGIHKWKVKMMKGKWFVLGIHEPKQKILTDRFYLQSKTISFGYSCSNKGKKWIMGKSEDFGLKYKIGDTAEMILNMDKKTLSFSINNSALKEMCKIKKTDVGYSMAVCLGYGKDHMFELLSYSYTGNTNDDLKSNESEQKQVDQLKKENLKLMNELNEIKKTNARNLDDISNQNDVLKAKNLSLNEMMQRLKAEMTDIKQLNQSQTQSIAKQQNQIQTLKRENLKVKNEMNEIKESDKLQKQKIAKQQNEIQTLQNQYESAENEMNELKRINKTQSDELNKLMDDEKEYQLQIKDLMEENKKLKMKAIDTSRYSEWSTDDILLWILSLENGRYSKYEKALKANLKEEGVNGDDLDAVDSSDVKDWGVTAFKDKKSLHQSIKQLTSQNQQKSNQYNNNNDNEGGKIAPTAYI